MILCTLTVMVTKGLDLNPAPYIMTEIIVSNATATCTVVGSFVNLLVAGRYQMAPAYFLSYAGFLVIGMPFALIAVFITYVYLSRYYRKDLNREGMAKVDLERLRKSIMAIDENEFIKDRKFFRNSAFILVGTLVLFAASSFIGIPFYLVGLMGAFAFIFMSGVDPIDAFHRVDWSLIFFIMGLFIVVGGLNETGLLAVAGSAIGLVSGGSLPLLIVVMTLFAGTVSGFLDDISVTTAMLFTIGPIVTAISSLVGHAVSPAPVIWSIMISANLGGNISPIGGVANIMGITALQKAGAKQTWKSFFKVGVPLTIIFLGLTIVYMILVSAIMGW
jgi:Na+/H+ antiporter NhaD/arsenite permease-like protein